MKRVFLLMVVSALLVTLGFAQTPDAGSNTDPANVKGCLGGSDGNYTVVEDGTRQIFKITTSSVDLKPHLGHDVKLTGHKASGAASSGAADNSFAVTELSMISEHCAAAAAATAAAVDSVFGDCHRTRHGRCRCATPQLPAHQLRMPRAPPARASCAAAPAVDAAAPAATVSSVCSGCQHRPPCRRCRTGCDGQSVCGDCQRTRCRKLLTAARLSAHARRLAANQAAAAPSGDSCRRRDAANPVAADAATASRSGCGQPSRCGRRSCRPLPADRQPT